MLVGHLEKLASDRAIIRCCQLRIDSLYFLDYQLGEALPWHSTLSRTRQRLPDQVFESCFQHVLTQCAEAGLVNGQVQAIDSAYVEANASLDTLEAKKLANWRVAIHSETPTLTPDRSSFVKVNQFTNPNRVACNNRSCRSLTDPESRLATKPGKPFRLYYLASMVVDTAHHVITHIQANLADEKDSRHLLELVNQTATRLQVLGLPLQCVLVDAGYGSGTNYAALEQAGITAYRSLAGAYTRVGEPFTYDSEADVYRCSHGAVLKNHGIRVQGGYGSHFYLSKASACKGGPILAKCCGKKQRKTLAVTVYRNFYERMQQRLRSAKGKRMKRLRSAPVEPVFGSLLNFFGMRRSNARGQ